MSIPQTTLVPSSSLDDVVALKRRQPFRNVNCAPGEDIISNSMYCQARARLFQGPRTRRLVSVETHHRVEDFVALDVVKADAEVSTHRAAARLGYTHSTVLRPHHSFSRKVLTRWIPHVLTHVTRFTISQSLSLCVRTERSFWNI